MQSKPQLISVSPASQTPFPQLKSHQPSGRQVVPPQSASSEQGIKAQAPAVSQ